MSELLTVNEVATVLKTSPKFVRRVFRNREGVLDLSGSVRNKRTLSSGKRMLRIPRPVLDKFILEKTAF